MTKEGRRRELSRWGEKHDVPGGRRVDRLAARGAESNGDIANHSVEPRNQRGEINVATSTLNAESFTVVVPTTESCRQVLGTSTSTLPWLLCVDEQIDLFRQRV